MIESLAKIISSLLVLPSLHYLYFEFALKLDDLRDIMSYISFLNFTFAELSLQPFNLLKVIDEPKKNLRLESFFPIFLQES